MKELFPPSPSEAILYLHMPHLTTYTILAGLAVVQLVERGVFRGERSAVAALKAANLAQIRITDITNNYKMALQWKRLERNQ